MSKKTKQILSMLISVVMIFSMLAGINLSVSAENDILDYLTWEINNGEVTITSCDPSISGDVVIPDTIEGYPVTAIGYEAFYPCIKITNVVIPDTVTIIGAGAFTYCIELESVIIPDSVTTIGSGAFGACLKIKSISIPDSVLSIGESAFRFCASLEDIIIGNGVTLIEDYTFSNCFSLKKVTIGNRVTSIGTSAFSTCPSLESINIPDSVEVIGNNAFEYCTALKNICINNSETLLGEKSFGYTTYEVLVDSEEFANIGKELFIIEISSAIGMEVDDEIIAELEERRVNSFRELPADKYYVDGATIYGHKGSTAEAYANENNLTFAEIGQVTPPVEEEPEVPELPDVPETPENPEENKPENDFFGIIRAFFEKIVNFFEQIFAAFMSIFA